MTKKLSSKRRKLIAGRTSSEHSRAAEVISSNVDLLTEILIRVPAKSLIRFRCVSKHWLSLISDSQFASDHTARNHRSSISGLYVYFNPWSCSEQPESLSFDGRPSLPTLAFLDGVVAGSTTKIAHSCNGLMLCSNGFRMLPRYIVCNPTTKKYTVLPEPGGPSSGSFSNTFGAYLAFDPSKSLHYKVVLINYSTDCDGYFYLIGIYFSESASWKHMRFAAPPGYSFEYRVFWNGAIHWMNFKNFYIRFDVDAETLIGTPLPAKIGYFREYGGRLFHVEFSQCYAMEFRIREMDRNCGNWIGKYRVNLGPLTSEFPEMVDKTALLCVLKGANEKDLALVLAIPGKVILYNRNRKAWKVLCDLPPIDESLYFNYAHIRAYQFIESLCPV